mgnify:CR=1 FL=1
MPSTPLATRSVLGHCAASPQAVWDCLSDVARWHEWNPGVRSAALDGFFAEGAWFTMDLPEGMSLRSRLVDVVPARCFTDETEVGPMMVCVRHEILPSASADGTGCRICYTIEVRGPDAQSLCDEVSSDFPQVIEALAQRAHAASTSRDAA